MRICKQIYIKIKIKNNCLIPLTFPEPRKPVITVAGTRLSKFKAAAKEESESWGRYSGEVEKLLELGEQKWNSLETNEWRVLGKWEMGGKL